MLTCAAFRHIPPPPAQAREPISHRSPPVARAAPPNPPRTAVQVILTQLACGQVMRDPRSRLLHRL